MPINENFVQLIKTVKVTDPENWYRQPTVDVSLYVTRSWDNKTIVRVFVFTIDDFAVSLDYECESKYEDQIKSVYNHYKKWIYDRMPEEVSLAWFYEHGFLPV